jgi:hypothetical protein
VIPFASQRGGGQDLATHLLNAYDNESTEVAHIRGAIADDLHGAFKEWEVQADTLTRCEKYLYSLSINPDPRHGTLTREQYLDYVRRAEDMLGLTDQPRPVVFHVKEGREHCHVVWSRVDAEHGRAVHLAFDHDKLMRVTRAFARDHGITLPKGYEKSRQVGQFSLHEQVQKQETGLSKADHMREVTDAWLQSDDPRAFVQALAERGYILATGKRPYVLVDLYGNANALPKLIDDKAVRTADIRAFLEEEFPVASLPSVEEAEKLVADHRKVIEQSVSEDRYADRLAELKQSQRERRVAVERERARLDGEQRDSRLAQQRAHSAARDDLRRGYRQKVKEVREERERNRPVGLAAFLGRITGVDLIRRAVHRHQDRQRFKAYRAESRDLKTRQEQEARALEARLKVQAQEVARKDAALAKVEKRELAAFMRDRQREQRIRDRGGEAVMPSLEHLVAVEEAVDDRRDADLLAAFGKAKGEGRHEPPDLLAAFRRAAKDREESDEGSGSESGLDRARPPDWPPGGGPESGRGRER